MTKKEKEEKLQEEEAGAGAEEEKTPDYYDQLLRTKAEFENYRKRTEKEKIMFLELGKEKTIEKFLPLYDAMLKAKEQTQGKDTTKESLQSGLEMVFKELSKIFDSEGVKVMDTLGKPYDPMNVEVLTTMPCAEDKDGCVIEEVQKGFTLNGRPIRCAKVCVGKAPEENKEKEDESQDLSEETD